MTTPTFAIVVTFRIQSDHASSFETRVLQQAFDSVQSEPGCLQFDVLVDEADPNTFLLYETYVDAGAFDDHLLTPQFHEFDQQVASWIVSKEVRRLEILEKLS